jgi:hypothetical protein
VLPFLFLLPRNTKRNAVALRFIALWLLFIHWVDMYWLVLPNLHIEGAEISWMDFSTMLGIGGIFVWYFWKNLTAHALVPAKDPRLAASMRFINT